MQGRKENKTGENWFTSLFSSLCFLSFLLFFPRNCQSFTFQPKSNQAEARWRGAEHDLSQSLLYQFQFLLGVLMTFQKTAILMKTTQAPEIKLTAFVKMQGWRMEGGERGVKGKKKERKENGKIKEKSLSGCIHACKDCFVYQALFCPLNKHTCSYCRAEKLQRFFNDHFCLKKPK